jgi:glutamate-5-semialdehyde dehydrogenase
MLNAALQKTQRDAVLLRRRSFAERARILLVLADSLERNTANILAANEGDLAQMDRTDSRYDRLLLTADRIAQMASALRELEHLEDPVGKVLLEKTLANGLLLQKKTVPMGVIGTIYEARPNVTIDVAALCLLSGNAAVLKGGKEAYHSNSALVKLVHDALVAVDLPTSLVQLLPTDRMYTAEMLKAERYVDLIIPRGSQALIQYVREHSRIPTIETGAGVCHVYVDEEVDLGMAAEIVVNAKGSRPSVCNALDTLLVHRSQVSALVPLLKPGFDSYGIRVQADEETYPHFVQAGIPVDKADEGDFGREWLDYILSVRAVDGLEDALSHIRTYSSRHSEAIISSDLERANRFLEEVDAAAVYHNASTRFTDGGEFGLGAEIGISTQKLHARGPFALEKLVTEKWIVQGNGQIR